MFLSRRNRRGGRSLGSARESGASTASGGGVSPRLRGRRGSPGQGPRLDFRRQAGRAAGWRWARRRRNTGFATMLSRWACPVSMGVGGTFDVLSGRKKTRPPGQGPGPRMALPVGALAPDPCEALPRYQHLVPVSAAEGPVVAQPLREIRRSIPRLLGTIRPVALARALWLAWVLSASCRRPRSARRL